MRLFQSCTAFPLGLNQLSLLQTCRSVLSATQTSYWTNLRTFWICNVNMHWRRNEWHARNIVIAYIKKASYYDEYEISSTVDVVSIQYPAHSMWSIRMSTNIKVTMFLSKETCRLLHDYRRFFSRVRSFDESTIIIIIIITMPPRIALRTLVN